jgi:hypothetical protein
MPEQSQALAVSEPHYNPLALMPRTAADAKALAQDMSTSMLIPVHLQKKPGDCLMIVMQAYRWQMDPFVVANCTSVVHGRLCYEGKLVAAALTTMNALEGRLEYEIEGKDDQASISITGTPRGGKPQTITGTVKGWRTRAYKDGKEIQNNWDKDPISMLVYRGTRQWARLFAPEALLGVYTPDELDDTPIDVVATTERAVPEIKKAEPIVDAEVIEPTAKKAEPAKAEPKKAAPTKAEPAAAQQQSQPSPSSPSSTAPAATQETAAAATGSGSDLPFDAPDAAQTAAPAATEAPAETASTTDRGEPLTESMTRVLESRRTGVKVSKEQLAAKYPNGIGLGNLNEALKWLEDKRAAG